jgi:hypothetical protein
MRIVLIAGGVLLVLLFSVGIGWLVFRRMLMPQTATNLPPSGARPWSRTRSPDPDSLGGIAHAGEVANQANMTQVPNFVAPNMGFGPGPVSFDQISKGLAFQNADPGSGSDTQGFQPANLGFTTAEPAGFGPQGMNGYNNGYGTPAAGFGGFSDGFIPPSPQIFPQSDASMIPPGSGAFPVVNSGFAPASSAFNAMYGLPGDPFSSSQNGAPGWMDNLNSGNGWQGNGFAGSQQSPSPAFTPGEPGMNDPYLTEAIRQYSQTGEAAQPPPVPQPPQSEQPGWRQDSHWLQ